MTQKDKLINKGTNERLLVGSAQNRAVNFMNQHDVACITAFRAQTENEMENKHRNLDL